MDKTAYFAHYFPDDSVPESVDSFFVLGRPPMGDFSRLRDCRAD